MTNNSLNTNQILENVFTPKKGDIVTIYKTEEEKEVFEFECVEGVMIYYMTDNTSYSKGQIIKKSIFKKVKDILPRYIDNIIKSFSFSSLF